jgi:hypothetical protein
MNVSGRKYKVMTPKAYTFAGFSRNEITQASTNTVTGEIKK